MSIRSSREIPGKNSIEELDTLGFMGFLAYRAKYANGVVHIVPFYYENIGVLKINIKYDLKRTKLSSIS